MLLFLTNMIFFVYILYSEKIDRFYVGHTYDLNQRLAQHNAGRTSSTKAGRPWKIVYKEEYPDNIMANNREIKIKKMKSRKYIEELVKNHY